MIHKNDTFWYNKINFREGIENMKKIVLFLLAGFMMISVMACSKDEETVQDVMEKVQQNYTDVFGLEMEFRRSKESCDGNGYGIEYAWPNDVHERMG